MALSLFRMGAELRSRSVSIRPFGFGLTPIPSIREQFQIVLTYWRFKRAEVPLYIWTLALFAPEVLIVPLLLAVICLST